MILSSYIGKNKIKSSAKVTLLGVNIEKQYTDLLLGAFI